MVIRGCIGDGIDHFRFDFVRLATARLGKGDAKGRQLPLRVGTFGFMTLFFRRRASFNPRAATKGNRWKNAADGRREKG